MKPKTVTRITKKYPDKIEVLGEQRDVVISEGSKELIQEFINNHTQAVCAYGSMSHYRTSVISTKYLTINPMDAVGRITNINYDTREVEIELSDDCNNPDSYRYIDPSSYDKYDLKIRGLCSRTAGEPLTDVSIKVITFDLVAKK